MRAAVRASCEAFDIPPPPASVHLKQLQSGSTARLFAWSRTPVDKAFMSWLQTSFKPANVDMGTGSDNLVICDLEEIGWMNASPFDAVDVSHMVLDPDGEALLHVIGEKPELEALLSDLSPGEHDAVLESLHEATVDEDAPKELLTDRQREVLKVALEEGYYEIPRATKLRDLAETLNTSSATLSEILRRTERRLAEHHLRANRSRGETKPSPPRGSPSLNPDDEPSNDDDHADRGSP